MPDWSSRLDIVQPVLFPMLPYKHLGLLASTNRALRAAIDKIGRNFTHVTKEGREFERHEFTIHSYNGESLMIQTIHPLVPSIGVKLDDEWYLISLSSMDKQVPYDPDRSTECMPLVLHNAGCEICAAPLARNETKIWFLKTPMGKVEHDKKSVDLIRLTLYLGCNLGRDGYTVSSAYITYLMDDGRVLTT